jgi:hypothetical protein
VPEEKLWTSIDLNAIPTILHMCMEHGVKVEGNFNDDGKFTYAVEKAAAFSG